MNQRVMKQGKNKEYELREEGYDTDEEVRVWIEDVEITR